MKVFVTGGTGFVGRYVVEGLIKSGHNVALGVRNEAKARKLFGDRVEVYKVNFSSKESIKKALEDAKPQAIVHLIGILFEERRKGITFEKVHYLFSKNLVEVSSSLVEKFVFMSALGTHDLAPSRYHQTKRWAEKEIIRSGIRFTILRPSIILGPEQRLFYDLWNVIKIFPVVALPGGGYYKFSPVDVRDVAQAFVKALEDKSTDGKIYELCGTREVTFKRLLQDIFSFWNKRVLMVPLPKGFMYLMGKVVETFIEPPPFSSDQMLMMWRDNVCGWSEGVSTLKDMLGRDPISYEDSLRWSLENARVG